MCNICKRDDVPVYPYQGYWQKPEGPDENVYQLCGACIEQASVRWIEEDGFGAIFGATLRRVQIERSDITWEEGQEFVDRGGYKIRRYRLVPEWTGRSAELIQKLRRTPQSPLTLQGADWVVCCGDLCEFIGSPKSFDELIHVQATAKYWNHGLGSAGRNFASDGPPEELEEVSVFRCGTCNTLFWVDQYT